MEITEKTVDRISKLCKLSFAVNEKQKLIDGLNGMMGFVAALENLDTGAYGKAGAGELICCPLREDEAKEPLDRDELLRSAPLADNDAFLVPKTVEEG